MVKKLNQFLEYVLELLEPAGGITSRAMFGGYGIYRNGVMSALIAYDTLYFKVDDNNRSDYENAGSQPFTYEGKNGKKATMSYWEVPTDIMEDTDELITWLEKAYQAGVAARK